MHGEIASITESELGEIPVSVARVDQGLLHETYEIRCDSGEYVLQFSSDADENQTDALRRGLNCYVALQRSEIPVPGVVTTDIAEFDGRAYSLVEKLTGETGERDISPERARNAGRYLAAIHDAKRFDTAGWIRFEDQRPSVREFEEGGLQQWILRTVKEASRTLRDGGLGTAGNEVEHVFDQFGGNLPNAFQPVLCHNDYSPDNVLFRDGEVAGILDFDRAHASHSHRDLAKAANAFWMHDPCSDWDVRASLYEGYRSVTELDDTFERNEPLYRAETLAGTVAGLLAMDELSEYEREFYAERILEALERVEAT